MPIDIKQFALQTLDQAKEDLERDGYLIPVAFIIQDDSVLDFNLEFEGEEEKRSVYSELVHQAKENKALAVITINDAHFINDNSDQFLEGYFHGKLAAEGASECIYLTVTGPSIITWTITVPYHRENKRIVYEEQREATGDRFNLLQGWASANPTVS